MRGETVSSAGGATASSRSWVADLATALAHAQGADEAAERLAEHLVRVSAGSSARVYLLGRGDRCATCPRAKECPTRDRCLHLTASRGTFGQPMALAERVPRVVAPWASVLAGADVERRTPPAEIAGPPGATSIESTALLVPLRAGGEILGVVALRSETALPEGAEALAQEAAFLAGAAVRAALARTEERRRFEQLLLVNDLGRKVNSILNLDLLLRQ